MMGFTSHEFRRLHLATFVGILSISPLCSLHAQEKNWSVPIVMEEATVRGKVAVLETRREEREVLEGVRIQLWSTEEKEEPEPKKKKWFQRRNNDEKKRVRKNLIHETKTDEVGLFVLPRLSPDEYLLTVSEVQFRVTVVPKAKERIGQEEPKVILVLIPRDVIDR